MFAKVAAFPDNLIILPGRDKFPIVKKWQTVRETPGEESWSNARQMVLLCGEVSGVTCIDVDGDFDWFGRFIEKYNIPDTTMAMTPSGGLHLYYKYDKRVSTTTRFWGNKVDIDVRNDRAIAVLPGSVYETRKKEKQKYIGKRYKFGKKDGVTLDFSQLQPMPEIFAQVKRWGIDKETLEIKVPKVRLKKYPDLTAGTSELTADKIIELGKAI